MVPLEKFTRVGYYSNMAKIKSIEAREILNAKGFPTIEATVILSDGKTGTASCPTGGIIGNYESVDIRDNDPNRYEGQGVTKAINNIKNLIAPPLIGKEAEHQQEIDKIMIDQDGTQNKSRLGANAIHSVSMAVARAGAESSVLPLFLYLKQFVKKDQEALKIPVPIFNFINGGKSDRFADFHEFLMIPASSKRYLESIQIGESIRKSLGQIIETKYGKTSDDYEEDCRLDLNTNREAFTLIQEAVGNANIKLGFDVFFGLNSQASTFYKDEKYRIKDRPVSSLSSNDLIDYYEGLNKEFHLLYLEDPLNPDDWNGWATLFQELSNTTLIAGGDIISTNPYRLQMAIDKKAVNAVVIKPNQIGTVIESLAIAQAAKETGLKIIVSHRSTETNDDFMADFAVAVGADYVKIGSLSRGENVAKYNRLMQIENQLKIL